MDRLMIVSADCHAGLQPAQYKQYVDAAHHDAFDAWVSSGFTSYDLRREATRRLKESMPRLAQRHPDFVPEAPLTSPGEFATIVKEHLPEVTDADAQDWGETSAHHASRYVQDLELRHKELDADGVSAEVVFPQGGMPFNADLVLTSQHDIFDLPVQHYPVELMYVGAHAYHRWLSDFVARAAGRMIGVATIPTMLDVERAVAELRWCAEHGLKGVLIRAAEHGVPALFDERYDAFWAACVELDMPVHWHVGSGILATYGTGPYASPVLNYEVFFWAHRPLWLLMFGGVLKRHPELRMIFTELTAGWLPKALETMDERYEQMPNVRYLLPEKPSEMWRRNCFVGATSAAHHEIALRDQIGVETMMFGTDFPHQEATWPHTAAYLSTIMRGCSEAELRMIAGENAARAYGLDVEKLRPIVERIGPSVDDVLSGGGGLAEEAATHLRYHRGDTFGIVL